MIEKIFLKIKEEFSEDRVAELLDEEIPNWVDEDWEEEHETAYDAYQECGRGEAENAVVENIMSYSLKNYFPEIKLNVDEGLELREKITSEYEFLRGY